MPIGLQRHKRGSNEKQPLACTSWQPGQEAVRTYTQQHNKALLGTLNVNTTMRLCTYHSQSVMTGEVWA